nr:helix-turn-helix domain-containing protein [Bacillus sp. REN3]
MKYLEENLGSLPLTTIAKKMGRSVKTLEVTMNRKFGSSNTKSHTGMITAGELARALKVDRNTVMCWIKRHGLNSRQRITHTKKRFTFIDIQDFWEWCYHHREKVNLALLEKNVLPPEPEWVEAERMKPKKVHSYKPWTVSEETILLEYIRQGMGFKEIADKLGRTSFSVEKKYCRLKDKNES